MPDQPGGQEEEPELAGGQGLPPAGPTEEDGGEAFSFRYSPGKLRGSQYRKMMSQEELEEEQSVDAIKAGTQSFPNQFQPSLRPLPSLKQPQKTGRRTKRRPPCSRLARAPPPSCPGATSLLRGCLGCGARGAR
ncbi:matrix-remodeling-associated protein 7 isoform X1 [Talpa occidentalis]|uniref:matrix-remodeling-associated protein 7 isoform X1 n=1 Tax=Talpa occidentalis TaxID=50954 RepID=UPI0023F77E49|nr:matrix-remodeling-associated protein 7 isoform X1 [Talpa occidentalis]